MKKLWKQIKDFLKLVREDYPYAIWTLGINGFCVATLPFVNMVFYSYILDLLMAGNYQKGVEFVIIMLVVSLTLGIIVQYTKRSIANMSETLDDSLMQQVTSKAMVMEYEEYEKVDSMDSIRMVRNQINGSGGAGYQVETIKQVIVYSFSVFYSLVLLGILLYQVRTNGANMLFPSLILVALFGLVMLVSYIISKKLSTAELDLSKKNVHGNSVSSYVSVQIMRLDSKKEIMLGNMEDLFKEYEKVVQGDVFTKFGELGGFYAGLISVAMTVFAFYSYAYVGYYAMLGVISIGNVLLYASSIQRLVGNISSLFEGYNNLLFRSEYLNEITKFINKPNLHYTGTLPIEKRTDNKYEFEFKNVSFKYPSSDNYVLKNVNLKLEVGKKMAVVGRNGAGKTTLVKLLCRLYEPSEGEILLNGINIEKYDYDEYTTLFAPVFQDFKLFALPINENIACGETNDDAGVHEVIQQVNLDERVNNMKDGIHTLLYKDNGEGVQVSGGEAQRLAIARALYKDAPFVILDEPTAALDPIAEAEIYENFNSLVENKTTLYISHRMSSCKFCDDIVVFREGEVVEQGNHEKLLDMNGEYASLYNAQANYYA